MDFEAPASLLGWRLALATQERRFHVHGDHLAAISCSADEKIGFPDHSCRCEFYSNRSALFEIIPLEEEQSNTLERIHLRRQCKFTFTGFLRLN